MTGRLLLAALAAAALAGAAQAQSSAGPDQRFWDLFNEGQYLAAVDRLRCSRAEAREMGGIEEQIAPMLDGYSDPAPLRPGLPPLGSESAARLRRAQLGDAVAVIAERAKSAKVVILNEHHARPEHRAFALQLARALRPLGYSILAAEAFGNLAGDQENAPATRLLRDGYPRRSTGFYTKDPVFGDFVRQSLALGYRPAAYEQRRDQDPVGSGIPEREQAQAENLAAITTANPGAKILAFVGFSHLAEVAMDRADSRTLWMAGRLKQLTGIDPLTVDQTTIDSHSLTRQGREAHAILAGRLRRSSVLQENGRPFVVGGPPGWVDLQVVHPSLRLVSGRPAWLGPLGRRLRPIPKPLLPTRGRRLVQAFLANEPADAIPVEQVVVEVGKPVPRLMLPRVPVRFVVQDALPSACARTGG